MAILVEDLDLGGGYQLHVLAELALAVLEQVEGVDQDTKGSRIGFGFDARMVEYPEQVIEPDERDNRTDEVRPEGPGLPEAEAKPVVKFLFLLAGSQAGEAVRTGMVQGFPSVVALVEYVKLIRGALVCGIVRGDLHKALSLNGLRELCKYLILNRLRPHNKTEEEKNQEKKKKNL